MASDGGMRLDAGGRLSDVAYEQLRDLIVRLEIPPGAPIVEDQVSQKLGVGLTPIRDALKRLTFERLVTIYPRRGTFASDINIADDQWLAEIRGELEGLAAALAAERATEQQRKKLLDLASQMQSVPSSAEFTELDSVFHRTIYAASHNPVLEGALGQYFNLALRIWNFGVKNFARESIIEDDFVVMATAISNSDAEAARNAMRKHIQYSRIIFKKNQ